MNIMDPKTLELLKLWGNPFYVDWSDPFRHPDDLRLFVQFAERASRYEWEDVLQAMKGVIKKNITDDEELFRDTLDLAVSMYQLIPKKVNSVG
jgi:hypothetical protein